jgi:transcriptional regulator with XRE-family HTH domain
MQSDKPRKGGAPEQHPSRKPGKKGKVGEVLTPMELQRYDRGAVLQRRVRAAAALHGYMNDTDLADAIGRSRIAVGKWWRGSRPEPEALAALSRATGLSFEELMRFVYDDGPPPGLPDLDRAADSAAEGARPPNDRVQ